MLNEKLIIGWREWVCLPDLGIRTIKVKVDTGARSSSLHAYELIYYKRNGHDYVKFKVHPKQRDSKTVIQAHAQVLEYRKVKSSNGHISQRPVIITHIELLGKRWPIEVTLANRDEMGFRMLLGRESFRSHMLVDAGKSYYGEKHKQTQITPRKRAKKSTTRKKKKKKLTPLNK